MNDDEVHAFGAPSAPGAAALAAIAESSREGIRLSIDGQTWPLVRLDGDS